MPKLFSMKKQILISLIATVLFSCNSSKSTTMENSKKSTATKDNTPKVIGIGGIFFFTDNPKDTREWYAKNLGLEINNWGASSFDSRDIHNPDQVNTLQWTPFKTGNDYFSPSKKDYMINYRVQNLEGLLVKLKENGVTILDDVVTYDFGKFVHIMDAEGTKIELWEPVENDPDKAKK